MSLLASSDDWDMQSQAQRKMHTSLLLLDKCDKFDDLSSIQSDYDSESRWLPHPKLATKGSEGASTDKTKESSTCLDAFTSFLNYISCIAMAAIVAVRYYEWKRRHFIFDNLDIFFTGCILLTSLILLLVECKNQCFKMHASPMIAFIFKGSLLFLVASHLFTSPILHEQWLSPLLLTTGCLNVSQILLLKSTSSNHSDANQNIQDKNSRRSS